MRTLFFLLVVLLALSFPGPVNAGNNQTVFWDARVESIDPKTKAIMISVVKSKNAAPVRHDGVVREEDMRRQLATGRKVKATFADLKPGQRVKVTMLWTHSFSSPTWATNLLILNTKEK